MTDLVKRLETHAYAPNFTSVGAANLMLEAKARIEALEAEVRRLEEAAEEPEYEPYGAGMLPGAPGPRLDP